MERTLISHNVETGEAEVRFEHNGVTIEQKFNLKMVIPGSQHIFDQMGIEFTEAYQLTSLDKLTENIKQQIDSGAIIIPRVVDTVNPTEETPPED